jgi:hypothetical protein
MGWAWIQLQCVDRGQKTRLIGQSSATFGKH